MQRTDADLRDQVHAFLNASRELSPAEDAELVEVFVNELSRNRPRRQRNRLTASFYGWLTALGILLAIPVVMVIQTYSARDGYLPPLDAGALPNVYWLALALVLICLIASLIGDRSGWRLEVTHTRERRT